MYNINSVDNKVTVNAHVTVVVVVTMVDSNNNDRRQRRRFDQVCNLHHRHRYVNFIIAYFGIDWFRRNLNPHSPIPQCQFNGLAYLYDGGDTSAEPPDLQNQRR
jgi:hypothetical protein